MNKDYINLVYKCKEILNAVEKLSDENACIEDIQGDIQADISDVMYYALQLADVRDIASLVYKKE